MRYILSFVGLIFILAFFVIFALGGNPHRPRDGEGISVTGECLREVTPDRSSIVLTAEVTKPNATEASTIVNNSYADFKNAVEELKLKDMKLDTQEFSVAEDFEWVHNKQQSRGYKARLGLRVRTSELAKMGEVIALAAKKGIQNVGSLESTVSEERMKTEYEGCLEEALKNAHDKALKLAKSGEQKLGKLTTVSESGAGGGGQGPIPQIMNFKATARSGGEQMDAAAATAPGFEASARLIRVRISAAYELR